MKVNKLNNFRSVFVYKVNKAVDSYGQIKIEDGFYKCIYCDGRGEDILGKMCYACYGTGFLADIHAKKFN